MGIMPHTSVDEALELALSLDIPYWPQLPRISFHQDMFAQTAQNFPGIETDIEARKLRFNTDMFYQELTDYAQKMAQDDTLAMSGGYSTIYERFLQADLRPYHAVRGQVAGPITLGFNVLDEERKPILYNDDVKALLFDFIQRKANFQYRELKKRSDNAFVWVDEPGLYYVFSPIYGYNDIQAKEDLYDLFQGMEGAKGLHLCPNINLPYLLELGVELLSFNAYQLGFMPREYASAAAEFLRNGGVICWGIVPTEAEALAAETPETLTNRLRDYWQAIAKTGNLPLEHIARQALLAPAKCSVKEMSGNWLNDGKNEEQPEPDAEVKTVNKAFSFLKDMSKILTGTMNL